MWLAFKAAKSALRRPDAAGFKGAEEKVGYGRLFRHGILMHVSNPKAILTWVAIMSVALKLGAAVSALLMIISGCAAICVIVFCGYALLFLTTVMGAFYLRIRCGLDLLLAGCFTFTGLKLVFSRN